MGAAENSDTHELAACGAHPDATSTRPAGELGRITRLAEARRMFPERSLKQVIDATLTADDLALEVIEDLSVMPSGTGRTMFERALNEGIDVVDGAPGSLLRLFTQLDNPPDWVDFEQLHRGSIAYLRGAPVAAFLLSTAVSASSERAFGLTRSTLFTGRMSGELVAFRARETTRWLLAATRPGGMQRHGEGFKLTVQVRMLHARIRRGLARSPRWDWDEWGMPIADADGMYVISYDFTQAIVDALGALGVRWSRRELDDIYALWRYIGHVIGVPGHLLHAGVDHGRQLAEIYLAVDRGPDEECRRAYHARMRFASGLGQERFEVFPALVERLPPEWRLRLLYGLTRYLCGGELSDRLEVPNTAFKHLPRLLIPCLRLIEAGRGLGLIDDQKLAAATVRRLERVSAPAVRGESTLVPAEAVDAAIGERH